MGEPSFLSEEFAAVKKADPDVELVSTSGYGKNGAICVLQQTVRPQVRRMKGMLVPRATINGFFSFPTGCDYF